MVFSNSRKSQDSSILLLCCFSLKNLRPSKKTHSSHDQLIILNTTQSNQLVWFEQIQLSYVGFSLLSYVDIIPKTGRLYKIQNCRLNLNTQHYLKISSQTSDQTQQDSNTIFNWVGKNQAKTNSTPLITRGSSSLSSRPTAQNISFFFLR